MPEFVTLELDRRRRRHPAEPAAGQRDQLAGARRAADGGAGRPASRADVRAVVVYGGEKVFAAGADIKEMADLGPGRDRRLRSHPDRGDRRYRPAAQAGGRRRHRVCPRRRVRAGPGRRLPGRRRGRPAGPAGDHPRGLPRRRRHPAAAAADRSGQGQGADLHRAGRSRVRRPSRSDWPRERCPRPRCYPQALALATRLAAGPTLAIGAAKRAIDDGMDTDLAQGLRIESAEFAALFATEDQKNGMASFLRARTGEGRLRRAIAVDGSAAGAAHRARRLSVHRR